MKLSKKSEKAQRTLLKQIAVGSGVAVLLAAGVAAAAWADSKSSTPRTLYGKFLREINCDGEKKSVEEKPQRPVERTIGVVIPEVPEVFDKGDFLKL